jgi:murein DD-endopeptidase MepM/ murein hydrolase activator NlpD
MAALGLGAARLVVDAGPWTPGIVAAGAIDLPTAGAGEQPDRQRRDTRGSATADRKREDRGDDRERERQVPARQRKALAVGHSLPVPAHKAPKYRLDDRHHDYPALDLSLRYGTPVRAVTAGRVQKVTQRGRCGRGVIVRGRDGRTYTYCHGNKLLVRKGDTVPVGAKIMKSGNSGNSSGPHLHLQVASKQGRLLCPQHLLASWQKGKELPTWKVGRRRCYR